jgi:hypothetical protein
VHPGRGTPVEVPEPSRVNFMGRRYPEKGDRSLVHVAWDVSPRTSFLAPPAEDGEFSLENLVKKNVI